MQSKARSSGPQPSGSHPARVDLNGSKDQAQNLSGRKAEASGPVRGHWLNFARVWLNLAGRSLSRLVGRSRATVARPAAAEIDPLLSFASETQTAQGGLKEAARTVAPKTRFGLGWALLVLAAIAVVASIGMIAVNQLPQIRFPGVAVKDARVSIETRPPAAQVLIDGQLRGTTPIVLLMKPGAH